MSVKESILRELERTPESLLPEVLDFVQFLNLKHQPESLEPGLMSEPALAKDWLKPEEDEAWQDL